MHRIKNNLSSLLKKIIFIIKIILNFPLYQLVLPSPSPFKVIITIWIKHHFQIWLQHEIIRTEQSRLLFFILHY